MGIFKARSVVGIEMDAYQIRAAELGGTADKPSLLSLSKAYLPPGIVKEGKVADPKALSNILSRFWIDSKFKSRNILLGVSNQDVLLRFATVPTGPEEKMENIFRFHAQSFLPVPVAEVELDYVRLDEKSRDRSQDRQQGEPQANRQANSQETAGMTKVLYVAGRRSMLNAFLQAVTDADLKPLDIDVSLLALTKCIVGQVTDRSVAIVHHTKDQLGLAILDHGVLALARILTVNSSAFRQTENVYENMAADEATHEAAATMQPDYVANSDRLSEELVAEIGSSITYFLSQNPGSTIDMCVMNTDGDSGINVKNMLSENLGMDVKIINMAVQLDTHRFVKNKSLKDASDFSVSISLALRGLEV